MGNSNTTQKTTTELDTYLKDVESTQSVIAGAFNKCIVPTEGASHVFNSADLTETEKRCVFEYIALYSNYARGAYKKYMDLYNQHQQEMYRREMARHGGGE